VRRTVPPRPSREEGGQPVPAHLVPVLVAALLTASLVISAATGAFGLGSGPPPTPIPPSGSLSPFPQALHTPPHGTEAPSIRAASAALVNAKTGQVLYAKNPNARRAIASLTKLMTALVTVRARSLAHVVTVSAEAASQSGSELGLERGERIAVRSLLYALLLQSSNDAAVALAEDISGSTAAFVVRMDARAHRLGMDGTRFASPNGLDDRGYSSANDLATLTRAAIAHRELATVMGTKYAVIANPDGPPRHIQNRNAMLWLYPGAFAGKTGFTSAAGQCLVTAATRQGRTLISVVLGDTSEGAFDDNAALLNYGFGAFTKLPVIRSGDLVGALKVEGAAVDATAGATLIRLIRDDRVGQVTREVRVTPGLALPVTAGQVIGTVVVSVRGALLGTVPAIALRTVVTPVPVPDPTPSPGPGQRGAGAPPGPLDLVASLLRATFGPFL
jgi:D-alanyl-D-alanine carboxypeptidase (penicillin-binding protein 5/6)